MQRYSIALRLARRWLAGAVALYLLCSFTLGGRENAKPVFALALGGLTVALCWCKRRRAQSPCPRWLRALELIGVNVALTVVLGELGLRALSAVRGRSPLVENSVDAQLLVPGRDYGRGLHGNALGFPGPDFPLSRRPNVARVAVLGDSFAVGPAAPYEDNFLVRTEREIEGVEILNFGVSGTGPREYLTVLRRHVWAFEPDVVVVCFFIGNDVTETLATPRHLNPRQSQVLLFLQRAYLAATRSSALPGLGAAAATMSDETFASVEARRLEVCLRAPQAGLEKKWRAALGYLDAIGAECRDRRAILSIVLIPDEFQTNPSVLRQASMRAGRTTVQLDLEAPQRKLKAFCAERGWPCLDLLPALRGKSDAYAPRDTHWNSEGNRLAARELTPWLAALVGRTRARSQTVVNAGSSSERHRATP